MQERPENSPEPNTGKPTGDDTRGTAPDAPSDNGPAATETDIEARIRARLEKEIANKREQAGLSGRVAAPPPVAPPSQQPDSRRPAKAAPEGQKKTAPPPVPTPALADAPLTGSEKPEPDTDADSKNAAAKPEETKAAGTNCGQTADKPDTTDTAKTGDKPAENGDADKPDTTDTAKAGDKPAENGDADKPDTTDAAKTGDKPAENGDADKPDTTDAAKTGDKPAENGDADAAKAKADPTARKRKPGAARGKGNRSGRPKSGAVAKRPKARERTAAEIKIEEEKARITAEMKRRGRILYLSITGATLLLGGLVLWAGQVLSERRRARDRIEEQAREEEIVRTRKNTPPERRRNTGSPLFRQAKAKADAMVMAQDYEGALNVYRQHKEEYPADAEPCDAMIQRITELYISRDAWKMTEKEMYPDGRPPATTPGGIGLINLGDDDDGSEPPPPKVDDWIDGADAPAGGEGEAQPKKIDLDDWGATE